MKVQYFVHSLCYITLLVMEVEKSSETLQSSSELTPESARLFAQI
jgi:hypothetical protein